MDCSPPGSSVRGIFQARILEWLPFLSPGDPPNPGLELSSLASPALAGGFFTSRTTWEAISAIYFLLSIVSVPWIINFSILTAGDRYCSCPIWVPGALISLFLQGSSFSGLKCYPHMHIMINTQLNTQKGAYTDSEFSLHGPLASCSVLCELQLSWSLSTHNSIFSTQRAHLIYFPSLRNKLSSTSWCPISWKLLFLVLCLICCYYFKHENKSSVNYFVFVGNRHFLPTHHPLQSSLESCELGVVFNDHLPTWETETRGDIVSATG